MARAIVLVLVVLSPATARAQLQAQPYASGLVLPVELVQDPVLPAVKYVVEQRGRIRVLVNGVVQPQDFLNLTGEVSTGGEQGLLGLALAPDYATSGRFFVNFTNLQGDTVVARFERSSADPLAADPSSRFDLIWGGVSTVIDQPFDNHNGGHLAFGPDGYLYIALGDGGSGGDPLNHAQNPQSRLGKILRIDVNAPDGDPEGYELPPDNPFIGTALPEIWAFGLRNPWKFTFDRDGAGGPGTGAMLIGDVGQVSFEEVNYEPAGAGGRNYGWRLREGFAPYLPETPPAFLPLTDPILAYDRATGQSVTGGYVYRGSALGPAYFGRYFYADFSLGRVWSVALAIDPMTGDATAGAPVEHTAELGGSAGIGNISAFGVDDLGELYLVSYAGTIFRIRLAAPPPGVNLVGNGTFDSGFAGWQQFATPTASYIDAQIVSGELLFSRVPPPAGQSNQAVVFQPTGAALAPGTPIAVDVALGNSSAARKRLSIVLHDASFSDLSVCTFWLPAHAPLRTYRMQTFTTTAWSNATVSFYAATAGSDGGYYRIDDVSLTIDPALSVARTDCFDPGVPPGSGTDGPDLIANGSFSSGLAPWTIFGQLVGQIAAGVLEFYRPAGHPAGVVLQDTAQSMPAGEIVTATFALGNSSAARTRVTVLLHAGDFSDLAACTFWLNPGQPLSPFAMRAYATRSWPSATVSFYGATVGTHQWTRLDDVTFRRTPGAAAIGTECVGPGASLDGPVTSLRYRALNSRPRQR